MSLSEPLCHVPVESKGLVILALDVPRAIVTPPLRQWHHHDLFGGRGIHPPDELLDMDLAVSIGVDRPEEMQDGVVTQPPRKG